MKTLIIRVRMQGRNQNSNRLGQASTAFISCQISYQGIALAMPIHPRTSGAGSATDDAGEQLLNPARIQMFRIHFVGLLDVIRQPVLEKLQHGDRITQPARLQVIFELLDLSDEFLML